MQLIPLGDCAVLVVFKSKTVLAGLELAMELARRLVVSMPAGVSDIVPSYTTVAVHYEPTKVGHGEGSPYERVCAWIKTAPKSFIRSRKSRLVTIPVSYGGEDGPDIAEVVSPQSQRCANLGYALQTTIAP